MPTKTTTLQLVFLTSSGKKSIIALPDAAPNLAATEVQTAMTAISQADCFAKEGVDLYYVPQSASYIERTVTTLFTRAETEPEYAADAGLNRTANY